MQVADKLSCFNERPHLHVFGCWLASQEIRKSPKFLFIPLRWLCRDIVGKGHIRPKISSGPFLIFVDVPQPNRLNKSSRILEWTPLAAYVLWFRRSKKVIKALPFVLVYVVRSSRKIMRPWRQSSSTQTAQRPVSKLLLIFQSQPP